MYHHRSTLGPVELAFTDRHGGVSGVPFDSLDLAIRDGADAVLPSRNLALLLDDFAPGCGVAEISQVHGADVVHATGPRDPAARRPAADGIVTDRPDLVLVVRAADCVPVVLADPEAGVVGAAHAGRLGLATGVVPATLQRMRTLGARQVTAWIGPHVCGSCYEVPAAMQAEVGAAVPAARATTSWGTPSLDLGAGVRAQLADAGATVVDVAACTLESPDLYSHRRDGDRAGRHAGVVRLRGAA